MQQVSIGSGNGRGWRGSTISGAESPRTEIGLCAAAIDEEEAGRRSREISPLRGVIDVAETKKDDRTVEMLEQDGSGQEGAEHGWLLTRFNGSMAF